MKTDTYTLNGTPQKVYETGTSSHHIYLYTDSNQVYVGGSAVTAADGMDIHKDQVIEVFVDEHETLYAATETPGDILIVLHPSNS